MDNKDRQLQSMLVLLLLTGAVLLSYRFAWDSIDLFVNAIDHTELLFADFIRHYYPMGQVVFDSHLPAFVDSDLVASLPPLIRGS